MTERGDLVAELRGRRDEVVGELHDAAVAAGRPADAFRLVAATKGVPLAVVASAAAAGLAPFGESRVQEALPKVSALPDVEWHFIGRLQANKVRPVVRGFAVIHSVDSVSLLERIERIAAEEGARPRLLLQVNVSGEPQKVGLTPGTLLESAARGRPLHAAVTGLAHTALVGLTTIAPASSNPADARPWFRALREVRDALQDRIGQALPELSMGMSADAESAIAEGATLVRIGTRIFWGYSERDPP